MTTDARTTANKRSRRLVIAPARPLRITPGASSAHDGAALVARAARAKAAAKPAPIPVSPADGATSAADRAAFEALAARDDAPGAASVLTVKFLILGVDTTRPALYLVNSKAYDYHYDFATRALGLKLDLATFNSITYFTDRRKNLAGQILAHDHFVGADGETGLYAVEFWPTDPVKAPHVSKAYAAIKKAMPFAADRLRYHPAGETQEALFEKEKTSLRRRKVRSISTAELFENVTYAALNPGQGYGVLGVFGAAGDSRTPTIRDVVLFKTIPNDLGHVGGIITEVPQTPLSHINLKAKQDKTPNAYIKNATTDARVAPLIGKVVRFEAGPESFALREATAEEAEKFLESIRPPNAQIPRRDLGPKAITPLAALGNGDAAAFGAKTANVAELGKILPAGAAPDGFGVPFHFYDAFMTHNGLYDAAKKMMAEPAFRADIAAREEALDKLRKKIKKADLPPALAAEVTKLQKAFPAGQGIRCRSSTNNEDLVGFNGAGLYDSFTHRPDEGDLAKTLKQVWASLWNLRAYDEREFFRVDHLAAAMGVLVHPNTDDERANGVAITRNIYDPNWPGFYVNAQLGENLVTNPEGGAVPEEFLISAIGPNGEYEIQYIRRSSLAKEGEPVLPRAIVAELVRAMETIQDHFKRVYRREADPTFAMDIEFKVEKGGELLVKQARPVV